MSDWTVVSHQEDLSKQFRQLSKACNAIEEWQKSTHQHIFDLHNMITAMVRSQPPKEQPQPQPQQQPDLEKDLTDIKNDLQQVKESLSNINKEIRILRFDQDAIINSMIKDGKSVSRHSDLFSAFVGPLSKNTAYNIKRSLNWSLRSGTVSPFIPESTAHFKDNSADTKSPT